jgi:hypothetical protein
MYWLKKSSVYILGTNDPKGCSTKQMVKKADIN